MRQEKNVSLAVLKRFLRPPGAYGTRLPDPPACPEVRPGDTVLLSLPAPHDRPSPPALNPALLLLELLSTHSGYGYAYASSNVLTLCPAGYGKVFTPSCKLSTVALG
ncbi:hypothetical protein AAFF_G00402540 [Aldrovandia affinis]|uniref:Uncharacterized protein n=1 Tax=Aldrovandia affinis TaxID=143900 RepID=A0AAD7T7E0_9TELE|nr:hypothetical protein AAFF_G00402540 [Aldrovandia affinis]